MRYSLSTWTVHGLLGSGLSLLDLPAQMAARGIHTVEVCHFHLSSLEPHYLAAFRKALQEADVQLYSILIDTGNITSPDAERREADAKFIRQYIEVAAELGAQKVRIDAGLEPPTPEIVARSARYLTDFAVFARDLGVGVITENWHATSLQPRPLIEILDRCEGLVGLCADTGNAEGPDKYETLERLLPRAASMHFKARCTPDGSIDTADLAHIVTLTRDAPFTGPVSLIYGDTENEWDAVERLQSALEPYMPVRL